MAYYLHAPGIAGGDKEKARAVASPHHETRSGGRIFRASGFRCGRRTADRTEELLRKAVEVQPVSYAALIRLGNYCEANQKQKVDEGERLARTAIRMHPDRAAAYALLASALVREDKCPQLDAVLAQGEKEVPDNLLPYYRAANTCLARKADLARADRYFASI